MNQQAFSDMLDKVLAMFGRTPTGAMRGVCWDVCENLPDVFADYAVEQARDLDRQPGNLSKFFRDSWFRWRESHPAMAAKEQEFGCDFCHKGLIYFVKQEEGEGWSLEVAVCGHCRPGGQTQANIRQHGGEIVPPNKGLSICVQRNASAQEAQGGIDFSERLQAWRQGESPDERCIIPDDDRSDRAEGWC
jgi:hypothetical protein